jgi:hypothetical protein
LFYVKINQFLTSEDEKINNLYNMSIFRYNFNFIPYRDLQDFLISKLDSEQWEESIANYATIAHYSYSKKISYGFPKCSSMKINIKKILKELGDSYVLPFLHFNKKDMNHILLNNILFIEDGIYYLRNSDGKKELYNYPLKSIEEINKIILNKYKEANDNTQFILEKLVKKPCIFKGNSFEIRVFVLFVRIEKKYYTFLYPLLLIHFGVDDINMREFIQFLEIGYDNSDNINSSHPILKNLYKLIQKTALVISNFISITNHIYKIENEMKNKNLNKSKLQYQLFALDIILNEDNTPFIIDIVFNPFFNNVEMQSKILRENKKMYNDILDNFVIYYNNQQRLNLENSNFIILSETPQYIDYKILISKKISENDNIPNNELITNHGEDLAIKLIFENISKLENDNLFLVNKLELVSSKKINREIEHDNNNNNNENQDDCDFDENKDKIINNKIIDLLQKERKEKIIGIASATIPIFLASYLAKKTYQSFTKKK